MPRLAGDKKSYTFRMMRNGPGGALTASPYGFELDSVTSIIGEVIPKPFAAGTWYGFRMGLEGIAENPSAFSPGLGADKLEENLKKVDWDPNKRLDKSRDRGYVAHDVLELFAHGEDEIALGVCLVEEELYGTRYGAAVAAWWALNGATGLHSEVPVFSLANRYAGTVDLIKPGKEVIDLKTHKPAVGFTKVGKGPAYLSDLIQVRAYRMAWEEMGNAPLQGNRIVVVRSNGKFLEDTREVSEELWLKTLEMYRLMPTL